MSLLKVENLSYNYKRLKALNNVSFEIPEKTIIALAGPNGAGKSTLFKCLMHELDDYDGNIEIDGKTYAENAHELNGFIGYLPDMFGLYESLTVEKCLTYFAMAKKVPNEIITQRVNEVAEFVNLTNKLDENVAGLSRGMKQRLAIGQVIIHYPKVLLLDEPASGLDPEARIKLGELFIKLRDEKDMTLIVSSHILAELESYAEEILILESGNLITHKKVEGAGEEKEITTFALKTLDLPKTVNKLTELELEFHHENEEFIIKSSMDSRAQADLLKDLVNSGCEVFEFSPRKVDFQSEYLKVMQSERKS